MWANSDKSVKIFLTESKNGLNLKIISDHQLKEIFHSRVNSSRDIVKELKPTEKSHDNVKYYDLSHRFSMTTIWMAIEIQKDGKRYHKLTKTFNGSIYELVPNDQYWK